MPLERAKSGILQVTASGDDDIAIGMIDDESKFAARSLLIFESSKALCNEETQHLAWQNGSGRQRAAVIPQKFAFS